MEFRMESKTCLVRLLEKMSEKCLVSYSLMRHLWSLNPVKMASNKEACSANFKKVLRLLVNAERVKEKECDALLHQFAMFWDTIPVFGSERFAEDRVDTLFGAIAEYPAQLVVLYSSGTAVEWIVEEMKNK